jgi:hypothetical protein
MENSVSGQITEVGFLVEERTEEDLRVEERTEEDLRVEG